MILIILLIIFVLFLYNFYFNIIEQFCTPPKLNNSDTHIFWTGGYDSTFLLLQLLKNNFTVQPIYLKGNNLDSSSFFYQRSNVTKELNSMTKITNLIRKHFPHYKLKNFKVISCYPVNHKITKSFEQLYNQGGSFSRPINQYERMARVSHYYKLPFHVGLEKCGTGLDHVSLNKKINSNFNRAITPQGNLWIFKYFRIPVSHLTKKDMLQITKQNNWLDIIKLTWTCWTPINGKPCGKCDPCQHMLHI